MKYYEKIDGLRFVAIFLVLIEHFAFAIGKHISAGFYGVDLFFVISGYLITMILLKPNNRSFGNNYKNFIGRRTLRIFPIYYLTILLLFLLNLEFIRDQLFWLITYTYNYAWVYFQLPPSSVSHFWSLAVEEQFYLFWPFIVLSLKNHHKLLTTLIVAIIVLGYSQMVLDIFPSISAYNSVGLLTRMSSLGLGALGAVLTTQNKIPDSLYKNTWFEYLVYFVLTIALLISAKIKFPLLGLCSFYFVTKAAKYNFSAKVVNQFLTNKAIVRIGMLAYGVYIFHMPLEYYLTTYLFNPVWLNIDFAAMGKFQKLQYNSWIIKFPLYSFLSILLASLSYKYIESPILQLKDKFFKY